MRKRVYSSLTTTYTHNIEPGANATADAYTGSHELPIAVIHNLVGTTELCCSAGLVDLNYIASVRPLNKDRHSKAVFQKLPVP